MTDLTALILTFNEKENIGRTLQALVSLPKVIVLDSFSTDATCDIAMAFSNVHLVQRKFDTHATQWNYGLDLVETLWVLTLDADYQVSAALLQEIENLKPVDALAAYSAAFEMRIHGKSLRSSVYPPRPVLFRRDRAGYYDDGHTQKLRHQGSLERLAGHIYHDDRKPLSRWISEQDRYAKIEANFLLAQPNESLSAQDRLRKRIFFAAPVLFLYLLLGRGLIFDGWPGWYYVCQRTFAEILLSLRLLTQREHLEEPNENKGGSFPADKG